MDGPLDFESEDPLLPSPVTTTRRKKLIGLDDLVSDYYKEKGKAVERDSKRVKSRKMYDSDEDETGKEALLSRKIDECHDQMKEMGSEEEFSAWGLQLFGNQKAAPPLPICEPGSFSILQSFLSNDFNSLVGLTAEEGESFLEGLLVNGWLFRLVSTCGNVEKSIAKWTFNLKREELVASACDFWCAILSPKKEMLRLRIEWFPSYSELKRAIETYGYLFNCSSQSESVNSSSNNRGPPKNIRSWLKFITACCQGRSERSLFSTSEAEELVEVVISLSLDRQLQGLLLLLRESMQSIIDNFEEKEWNTSCKKIAKYLACRVPKDLNCLRSVEFISGVGTRSNHLRSAVSYYILLNCFDNKAANEEEILSLLISINVKEKHCDLFKMYIYLVLTQNWLLSDPKLKDNKVLYEMWGVYLQNCSCLITSTDLRPCASKVRTKASYLLHGTNNK